MKQESIDVNKILKRYTLPIAAKFPCVKVKLKVRTQLVIHYQYIFCDHFFYTKFHLRYK